MAGARQIVDPPSFTPVPYSLLTTVDWRTDPGSHWQNGITYQPTCGVSTTGVGATNYDPCIAVTGSGGPPPSGPGFTNLVSVAPRGATSFVVWTEFQCSTISGVEALDAAKRALAIAEPWQVERAFWTGLAGGPVGTQTVVFPHLAASSQVLDAQSITLQTAATIVTGSSVGVTGDLSNLETQLGLLEQALANCYDGIGVIHVPELAIPSLKDMIEGNGPVLRTLNGNLVAAGAGYPGTSPNGDARAGNKVWLYATGALIGYRSEVRVRAPDAAQTIDRSTNTRTMIAERTYVLGWDCCHFAAQATLGAPGGT